MNYFSKKHARPPPRGKEGGIGGLSGAESYSQYGDMAVLLTISYSIVKTSPDESNSVYWYSPTFYQ